MIPKKLRLKNFLSYGDKAQELDFDLFQFAVLTGENGAGKSSLIEAIPFCIWGEGREKRSELLRKGAGDARLELEFELQKNIYRITRILKVGKTSQELEFAIYDGTIGDFRTLTRERIKDTQDEIQKRLGITYETFINSAFFAQGKADSFIKNGPTQRRRVLGEILGLSRYETLSEKAKIFVKDLEGKLNTTLTRIELLQHDVEPLGQLRLDLQAKLTEERSVETELADLDKSLLALDSKLQAFQQKEKELAILNAEFASLTRELEQAMRALRQDESELSTLDFRLQSREALLIKQQQSELLKKEIESLEAQQSRAQSLKELIATREGDYNAKRAKLEAERTSSKEQLLRLNQMIAERQARTAKKATLLETHLEAQANLDALKKECARLPEVDRLLAATRTKVSDLKSQSNSAQVQMDAITQKGKKLKDLSDVCPLCQSEIDETHKKHILEIYRDEYRAHQTQKKQHEDALQTLQQELLEYEKDIDSLKKKEREQNQRSIDLNRITSEMASLEEVEQELKKLQSEKILLQSKESEAELELKSLSKAKTEIETLQSELSAVGYNPDLHQRKRAELKTFDSLAKDLATLDADSKRRDALLQEISEHRQRSESLGRQLALKEAECSRLHEAIQGKAEIETARQTALNAKQEKSAHLREASSKRHALEASIEEKEAKEKVMQALSEEIAPQREMLALYNILAEAYSVRGVQQLLLEKAIPEIERLANELLAQLTSNLFSLSFQTERETNSGTSLQTLEIIISDANANTRLYETFSGGERFRIDFSLRLALSKYLATTSGTPIKMLVIDEGFGTQDRNGIEAMIEAMNQVSDDFEKLILITHLEEMKDAFPTRIVVSKDPLKGSHFEVIS